MSFTRLPASLRSAAQLLAELQIYRADIRRLGSDARASRELVLFGAPGQAMERMRPLANELPQLSAQWVMVMISHTELMHNLWRRSQGEALDVDAEVRDHLRCVDALAVGCQALLLH